MRIMVSECQGYSVKSARHANLWARTETKLEMHYVTREA
jgi:hypothetical protein